MILNLINGKIYIGKSNSKRRWKTHLNTARSGPKVYGPSYSLIHKAIKKYGENNFQFRIIQYVTPEEAPIAERYWITFYKTNVWKFGNEFGYNLTEGGEGWWGHHHTEETKIKLRKLRIGTKHSNETIIKMKEDRKGQIRANKISESNVIMIKRLIKYGLGNRPIAKIFPITHQSVSDIRVGKTWKNII